MLRGNGTYLNLNAGRLRGGGAAPISQGNYQKVGAWRGVALPEMSTVSLPLIGYPSGYFGQGWFMPIKGGDLTSHYNTDISIDPTATILEGRLIEGTGDIGLATNTPTMLPSDTTSPLRTVALTFGFTTSGTGGLVSTVPAAGAPISFGFSTNTPLMTASLGGDGMATFGFTTTAELLAEGILSATATFGMTVAWTAYATGSMAGTTADAGVTIDGIVQALEAAILPVNIVQVNEVEVTGDGQSGSEWGPV